MQLGIGMKSFNVKESRIQTEAIDWYACMHAVTTKRWDNHILVICCINIMSLFSVPKNQK